MKSPVFPGVFSFGWVYKGSENSEPFLINDKIVHVEKKMKNM